jgi:prepilin-type N-terminal cleavage/methylation domain-containing protein
MNRTKQKGFSLIELLIVVTILGIVASIAIPNMYASIRTANEASAISSMRIINSGQATYQSTIGSGDFGTLNNLRSQGIIDTVLGNAPNIKSGYRFTLSTNPRTPTAPATYDLTSIPINSSGVLATTGRRNFYTNESHVIYFSLLPSAAPQAVSATDRTVTGGLPIAIY